MSEWYIPAKEDGEASAQADGSTFLLLVRGDRAPLVEESEDSGRTSEIKDTTLSVDQTPQPQSNAQTFVPECDVENTGTCGRP